MIPRAWYAIAAPIVAGLAWAAWRDPGGTFIFVWFATWLAVLAAIAIRVADRGTRGWLVTVLLVGAAARALCGWMTYQHALRNSDTLLYWYQGARMAALWETPGMLDMAIPGIIRSNQWGYYLWVALHAALLRDELFVVASNALVGAASGLLIYQIGREVASPRVGLIAAACMLLESGVIYEDTQNVRDGIATFCGLAAVYGAVRMSRRPTVGALLWIVGGLGVYIQIRAYTAAVMAVAIGLGYALSRQRYRLPVFLVSFAAAAGVIYFILTTQMAPALRQIAGVGIMRTLVASLAMANSGLIGGADVTSSVHGIRVETGADLIRVIPIGIVHLLFAPLPWKVGGGLGPLYVPGVLLRYMLLPFLAVGFWVAVRRMWTRTAIILFAFASLAVLYSVIEFGSNVRHNMQFFPYQFILVGIGIAAAAEFRWVIWIGFLSVSLALWIYGFGVSASLVYFPPLLLALAAFFLAVVRPWRTPPPELSP